MWGFEDKINIAVWEKKYADQWAAGIPLAEFISEKGYSNLMIDDAKEKNLAVRIFIKECDLINGISSSVQYQNMGLILISPGCTNNTIQNNMNDAMTFAHEFAHIINPKDSFESTGDNIRSGDWPKMHQEAYAHQNAARYLADTYYQDEVFWQKYMLEQSLSLLLPGEELEQYKDYANIPVQDAIISGRPLPSPQDVNAANKKAIKILQDYLRQTQGISYRDKYIHAAQLALRDNLGLEQTHPHTFTILKYMSQWEDRQWQAATLKQAMKSSVAHSDARYTPNGTYTNDPNGLTLEQVQALRNGTSKNNVPTPY